MKLSRIDLNVIDETSKLTVVILGIATSIGEPRGINAKSAEAIKNNTYPSETELVSALGDFEKVLSDNGVTVFKPTDINNLNQIFVRDLGFVVNDYFVVARMKEPVRNPEIEGLSQIFGLLNPDKIIYPPDGVYIEGGDIVQFKNTIFVGVGRRTNSSAVSFLRETFPQKQVVPFAMKYDTDDPRVSILHLDCAFQPIGTQYAILYEKGFVAPPTAIFDLFGKENIIQVSSDEMYEMFPNIFSLSPLKVVSCKSFTRLNDLLSERDIEVIPISFEKTSILGGLLRCSTLPLERSYE